MKHKGEFTGPCARQTCSNLNATFFNKATNKFYCQICAIKLQEYASRVDKIVLFPALLSTFPIQGIQQ